MLVDQYKDKYFMIYADCFITTGVNRTSILDVTNNKIFFINSDYDYILDLLDKYTIGEILDEFVDKEDVSLFNDFILEIIRIDVGCFVDDLKLFPKIEKKWDSPSEILNSIIDIRDIFHDFDNIISQLNKLRCKYLQVRSYRCLKKNELHDIVSKIKGTSILYVEIVTKYDSHILQYISDMIEDYTFLNFFIYSVPADVLNTKNELYKTTNFVGYSIESSDDCGKINRGNFIAVSLNTYMHNLLYNSCLNRKISIDELGNIKNCPSMTKIYGNIQSDSLINISRMPEFRDIWNLNKSHIKVCNVCEYRSLCSDCRAFISDKNDLYSKPLKCNYNPYFNEK